MKKKVVGLNSRQAHLPFTPETQMTFFKTPPGLPKSNFAFLQKKRSMMLSLLDTCNQKIEKNRQTYADEDKQDNLDATMNRINNGDVKIRANKYLPLSVKR
jgi:hypothetical protein